MNRYPNFTTAIQVLEASFRHSPVVHTERWQGMDISKKPEAAMHELLFISFQTPMSFRTFDVLRADVRPNLPWADDHFMERVGGHPLNPGVQWKNWPWSLSADKFRTEGQQFSHTYMERYWPKKAGLTEGGILTERFALHSDRRGIRYDYGDLDNVISLLCKEPLTRQAYLPIFFPEDTGDVHSERKPCTLGYHFIVRNNKLHIVYYIRSCDFIRHFRDDIYLTVRLADWVLTRCKDDDNTRAPEHRQWEDISLGNFVMHITSLHMFKNDWATLFIPGGN